MKPHLKIVAPTDQNRKVMPVRPSNDDMRTREYLLPAGIDQLIAATKHSRCPQHDATLILVAYRHGLRAIEAAGLEWSQVDFKSATLHARRVKNGKPTTHLIRGDELRALRQLQREQEPKSPYVFTTERGTPFTTDALNRLVKMISDRSKVGFPVHFHMLRLQVANDGHDTRSIQDWLGHRSIQHTVRYTRYTELTPIKFKHFWR